MITISSEAPLRSNVKRLGVNLGGQSFYDSGQMLRNLTFRNPGVRRRETWQSILRCKTVDGQQLHGRESSTPSLAGRLPGRRNRTKHMSGAAKGQAGRITVRSNTGRVTPGKGVTLTLSDWHPAVLAPGDFLLVRLDEAGPCGGRLVAIDLSRRSHAGDRVQGPARRTRKAASALRVDGMNRDRARARAVSSYFDSFAGHSFVQLRGYLHADVSRQRHARRRACGGGRRGTADDTTHGLHSFLNAHGPRLYAGVEGLSLQLQRRGRLTSAAWHGWV